MKRTGETFSVIWKIGSGQQIGTGILSGSIFSVGWRSVGTDGSGVASYQVVDGKVTDGQCAVIGAQGVGTERWTQQETGSPAR